MKSSSGNQKKVLTILLTYLVVQSSLITTTTATCNKKRCQELGVCAEVFQHPKFRGSSKCVYPLGHVWTRDCSTLSDWWQDVSSDSARASSVKTYGNCIKLWSGRNCSGDSLKVEPKSKFSADLSDVDFNDHTRSVSTCLREDEVSGASPESCTKLQLFFEDELSATISKNRVSDVASRLKDGIKFLLAPTPLAVFGSLIDALQLLVAISNDIVNYEKTAPLKSKIDNRITRERVHEVTTHVTHWMEELEMIYSQERRETPVNLTELRHVMNHAYDSLSIILLGLATPAGALMKNPLVSSPFLNAFAVVFFPVLEAKLEFDPKRKKKICRQGKQLVHLLQVYEENSVIQRINLIEETEYVNAFDFLTGKRIFHGGHMPASFNEMQWARPILNVCRRDWNVSIRNGMKNYFNETLQYATNFLAKNLPCSSNKDDEGKEDDDDDEEEEPHKDEHDKPEEGEEPGKDDKEHEKPENDKEPGKDEKEHEKPDEGEKEEDKPEADERPEHSEKPDENDNDEEEHNYEHEDDDGDNTDVYGRQPSWR